MQKLLTILMLLSLSYGASAQDDCSTAIFLCSADTKSGSTTGATFSVTDPALSCGDLVVDNSVWFQVVAINNGNCTVQVTGINNTPGLDMEVYSGICGSLTPEGFCAGGSGAGGGSMSVTFPTLTGTTYYIMVDGNGGNQELFSIQATTVDNAIIAKPSSNFFTDPTSGCFPLIDSLRNLTTLHGGTQITYQWKIDTGPYLPSTGLDTAILFNTMPLGPHDIELKVSNAECGFTRNIQQIQVYDLVPTISYLPNTSCTGTPIFFNGAASIQLDTTQAANITGWHWSFGDPNSGVNDTASGQSVVHTFIGPGTSFNVQLMVEGYCGPDSVTTVINLLPKPTVDAGPPQFICEGDDATLVALVSNASSPIVAYQWSGPGFFSCSNCDTTLLSSLSAGGPYTISIDITDSLGCTADTTVDITVNPKPVVDPGVMQIACQWSTITLNATPVSGVPPFTYAWDPGTGLDDSALATPSFVITGFTTYCVTMKDSAGCPSDPACVDNDIFPKPSASPWTPVLCASQPTLGDTIDVTGAGSPSSYWWFLSPDYGTIVGASPDSLSIYVSFPTGVVATYNFTVIVIDSTTGCMDTVSASIPVISGLNMSVSGVDQICQGDPSTWTASGASSYAWTASPPYAFADSTLDTQILSPAVTTIFTIFGTTGGCTGVTSDTLFVNSKPLAAVDTIPAFCTCATINLDGSGSSAGMTYLWSTLNGTPVTNPIINATTATVCGNEVFNLRVTDPVTLCFMDSAVVANPRPNPAATAIVSPIMICPGVPTLINLDGTGSDADPTTIYHWTSNPVAAIADTDSLVTTGTVSSATTFTLTVTDFAGCDSIATASLNTFPAPTLSASNPFLCIADPILQSVLTVNGANVNSSYTWTTIPACVSPNSSSNASENFDFGTCGLGVYNFNVTVFDTTTGCSTDLSDSVTLINTVVLTVTPDTFYCEGGTAFLYVSGANTFLWNPAGQTTDTIYAPGLTASGSPYTITVTGTVGSCTSSQSIQVTVNPLPVTSPIIGANSVCDQDTGVIYTAASTDGNFIWSVTGGTLTSGQSTGTITVNWNGAGTGTVSVYDTSGFGCVGLTQSLNVTVNALPTLPVIAGPNTICEFGTASYSVVPNAGSTYSWTATNGTIVSADTGILITVDWGSAGPGYLTLDELNSSNCASPTAIDTITINPEPLPPAITGNSNVCDSASEFYSVPFNVGSTYNWFGLINGSVSSISTNQDSASVFWTPPGAANISVTEINSFNCTSDTTSFPVVVNLKPQADLLTNSASICQGNTVQLNGITNSTTLHWQTSATGTFDDTTIATPVYTPGVSDTGFATLTFIASGASCSDDTAFFSLYVAEIPTATLTAAHDSVCTGTPDTLFATGNGNYLWSPGGETTSSIIVFPTSTTDFTVTVTNATGCSDFDTVRISSIPNGTVIAGQDQLICLGDSAAMNGSYANAGGLIWSTSGDGIFNPSATSLSPYYIPGTSDTTIGSATIYLTSTGSNCQNLTDTVNLSIGHIPSIYAGLDTTITSGSSSGAIVPLLPLVSNSPGIQWTSTGTGTFSPDNLTQNATYTPSSLDYASSPVILTLTSTGGCLVISDNLSIEFSPFIVPNVFTPYPNSPGFNDYFEIKNLPENSKLEIWNRWGLLVFTTDNYRNDWDAAESNGDAYYYVLKLVNGKEYHGQVRIIR